MTRKKLTLILVLLQVSILLQLMIYGFGIKITGAILTELTIKFFTPAIAYLYILTHKDLESSELLSSFQVRLLVWGNVAWCFFSSMVLFLMWGPIGTHISSESFNIYLEALGAFQISLYAQFIPKFFHKKDNN
ncbi:MAG: hypothetical protein IPL34_18405 [Thiofilum sp.]|uniref:hypothetical protein n=1 Tax=Thiofilum sp. TaxID=2212733 RepID=UPI0025FC90C1|nr:hypothetical protein [Thiofilum sp.]MBK8455265.1 hypothetical protein [Thiofilum sp.]